MIKVSLPNYARLPINHCNLPAVILGSLSFQLHPQPLCLDGVYELHRAFFRALDNIKKHEHRAKRFIDYMTVSFRMHKLEEAGLTENASRKRVNADYLRMLRGWLFDSNSREAAVLKSWVESRFGLLPLYHNGRLDDYTSDRYQRYLQERAEGLYATNALEAQIDLLFTYCQYELTKQYKNENLVTLYRGINRLDDYIILEQQSKTDFTLLMNNLNSFTRNRERADEFGDYIIELKAPRQKVLYYASLLPGIFCGEEEVLLIGGVYQATINL